MQGSSDSVGAKRTHNNAGIERGGVFLWILLTWTSHRSRVACGAENPPATATVLTVPQGVEGRTDLTVHAVQTVLAVEQIHCGLN